jgi:hypothetical protein
LLDCVWHGAFIQDTLLSPTQARGGDPQKYAQKNDEKERRATETER